MSCTWVAKHRVVRSGEKRFVVEGEEGYERKMTAQVCDVNKALLSVSKMVKAGNKVVFDSGSDGEGSYIEDRWTGERMYMEERGGMYILKLWAKKGF